MNARMADLTRCFEAAGFTDVRTVRSSGNVVFDARPASPATLARRAETAMRNGLDRTFATFVRPVRDLQELLEADPFAGYRLPPKAKCVVIFLAEPAADVPLPAVSEHAGIFGVRALEAFGFYVPGDKAPAFMGLLERSFGRNITTRTLDTVRKCAQA